MADEDNNVEMNNNNNNEEPSLLEQVVQRIQNFLQSVDAHEQDVDQDVARRLLEMANGNLDVVESLYYDHYFASLERGNNNNNNNNNRRAAQDEDPSNRRVRRRLERDLQQQAHENNENADDDDDESVESMYINQEEQEDDDQDDDNSHPELALPVHDDGSSSSSDESESSNDDDDDDNNNNEAGAAVSEDEGPRARRRPRRRRIRIHHDNRNNNNVGEGPLLRNISIDAAAVAGPVEPQVNNAARGISVKKEEEEIQDEDDIGDDFLSSDFDWIFQDGSSNITSSTKPPVLLLWGDLVAKQKAENESNNAANNNALPHGSNVVAQDDDDDDDDGDSKPETPKEGVPKTWLRAGFKSSKCGTGLITEPPDDEETSLSRWRQSGSRNIAPPPYHCLGVTSLLSVVTALMYSGASIQGNEVNCNAARTPFADLSEEERKHQFDGRLVDALSSLVWIAANASLERKKRALAKRKLASNDTAGNLDAARQQAIERKLQLIPTCRFEKDHGTGDGKIAEGRQVKIATSLTRMEDIRAYVVSTLRSFTKKGGCALFLETIVSIHGKTCVERMVRNARRKAGLNQKDVLIECECEARQKKLSQASSPTFGASVSTEPTEEPVPLDHTCISTELISLLLTGAVSADLQNWSTGPLNVGILTDSADQVKGRLLRPEKPVWIIRGDTCYSVAWLDGNKEHFEAVCRGACAGTLTHWNPWFGHRHKSTMRLLAARGEWKPPVFSKAKCAESEKKSVTASILARRKEQLSHVISSDEQENAATRITKKEIDQVKINPEDEELYPGNYRQWRFDMGHAPSAVKAEEDDVKIGLASSPCGKEHVHWIPYFRLNDHQQQVVAMKVSPAIKRILWSRWPGATIDRFTPEDDETPPAV